MYNSLCLQFQILFFHCFSAVFAFEPSDDKVSAGDVLEVIYENRIYQSTACRSKDRNCLGGHFLGNVNSETASHLRYKPDDSGRTLVYKAMLRYLLSSIGNSAAQCRSYGQIARFG